MTWAPGLPVVTDTDRAEWQQWRKERKREQQRQRRARYPRIDYYPSQEVYAAVLALCRPVVGGDVSTVLNRMVCAWLAVKAQSQHDCNR
jgi:hypothetical protein